MAVAEKVNSPSTTEMLGFQTRGVVGRTDPRITHSRLSHGQRGTEMAHVQPKRSSFSAPVARHLRQPAFSTAERWQHVPRRGFSTEPGLVAGWQE